MPRTRDSRSSVEKSFAFLAALLGDGPDGSVAAVSERLGIPRSTAYRMVAAMAAAGLVAPVGKGTYGAGLALMDMAARGSRRKVLLYAARRGLTRLARDLGCVAHMGILENDMVTYLYKAQGGRVDVMTRPGMQLEAYCSAIGKMLLASGADDERERYLAAGPFIALTARTLVDPDALRAELVAVRDRDYAIDAEEVADGLVCMAVPVRSAQGKVEAAISVSNTTANGVRYPAAPVLDALRAAAGAITARLG